MTAALAALAALAVALIAWSAANREPAAAPLDGAAPGPLPWAGGAGALAVATQTLAQPEPPPAVPHDHEITLVRRAFDALNSGDVDTAAALMHPDVSWPGDPRSGRLHGREEFRAHWAERLADMSIYLEPIRFEFDDDELVVTTHEVVRRRSADAWYGEYRTERRFSFRDGLIAAMSRRRPDGG